MANFRQNCARSRLYQNENLQVNTRLTAFFKIYQILKLNFLKIRKILQNLQHLQKFCWIFTKIADFSNRFFAKILRSQRCKSMQILQSLKNAVERIFSCKIWLRYSRERARQKFAKFAKNLPIFPILLLQQHSPTHDWPDAKGSHGGYHSTLVPHIL